MKALYETQAMDYRTDCLFNQYAALAKIGR